MTESRDQRTVANHKIRFSYGPYRSSVTEDADFVYYVTDDNLELVRRDEIDHTYRECKNEGTPTSRPLGMRTKNQRDRLQVTGVLNQEFVRSNSDVFDGALDWAYRSYTTHRKPVSVAAEYSPTHTHVAPTDSHASDQDILFLFNVIVGFEWEPGHEEEVQLKRAMRRASDILYDATDGQMAFGQVFYCGPVYVPGVDKPGPLPGADIQIMASNRIHPRATIKGLHCQKAYRPIRLGRGFWHRRYKITIPWDEAEGYRTIAHEWAHYALGLHDRYTETRSTVVDDQENVVVIPTHLLTTASFMAIPSIWSEIDVAELEKEAISDLESLFPDLTVSREKARLAGPDRLPLPLPRFQRLGSVSDTLFSAQKPSSTRINLDMDLPFFSRTEFRPDNHWIYVLKTQQKDDLSSVYRIIAQGTPDVMHRPSSYLWMSQSGEQTDDLPTNNTLHTAQDTMESFKLRGVAAGDVIAQIERKDGLFRIGTLYFDTGKTDEQAWMTHTLEELPFVYVTPMSDQTSAPSQAYDIRVHLRVPENSALRPTAITLFSQHTTTRGEFVCRPLDLTNNQREWTVQLPTLDGHVLVLWEPEPTADNVSSTGLMIYPFSEGGPPPAHNGVGGGNPQTAGSADGNVMIFFKPVEGEKQFDLLKIVTTRNYWPHGQQIHSMPEATCTFKGRILPADQMGDYVYSVAGNQVLDTRLAPTLVLYYDRTMSNFGSDWGYEPVLCRLCEDGTWRALEESYAPPDKPFVALPLTEQTARNLYSAPTELDTPVVESYRLGWQECKT